MAKQTLTVQLMHARAEIVGLESRVNELEATIAELKVQRGVFSDALAHERSVTPARAAYLARLAHAQVNAQVSDFAQRCAQARALAMSTGRVVSV